MVPSHTPLNIQRHPNIMLFVFILSFLAFSLITECQKFRSDYEYFSDVDGFLKFHVIPANWHEARLRCTMEGAVLASPSNAKMLSTMISLMKGKTETVFTGIHSTFSGGDFATIDGVPISAVPAPWDPSQPDNKYNRENCIILRITERIADVKCDNVHRYMCYRKHDATTNAQNECGTIDSQYELAQETGHCYKFHRTPRTWSRAHMACTAEGGYLVIINSQEEANVISRIFNAVPPSEITVIQDQHLAYVGVQDWGEHGTWMTVHGQSLQEAGYSKWGREGQEPNNFTGAHTKWVGEYCLSIYTNAELNDIWCEYIMGFFCEKDPKSLAIE